MTFYEWMYSFAQITFPALLLLPELVKSFRKSINPNDLGIFYLALLSYYVILCITGFFALHLYALFQPPWLEHIFMILGYGASVFLSGLGIGYVMKWSVDEQITNYLDLNPQLFPSGTQPFAPRPTIKRRATTKQGSKARRRR